MGISRSMAISRSLFRFWRILGKPGEAPCHGKHGHTMMYMYYSHLFSGAYAGHLLYIYIYTHSYLQVYHFSIYFGAAEITILRHTHVCSPNPSESSTPEGTKEMVTAAPAMRLVWREMLYRKPWNYRPKKKGRMGLPQIFWTFIQFLDLHNLSHSSFWASKYRQNICIT